MTDPACPACRHKNKPITGTRLREVRDVFSEGVARLRLGMSWVGAVEEPSDGLLRIFFRSPDRVDFRKLIRTLRERVAPRVELWRVDERRAAGISGDLGRCGRTLCCASWLERPPAVPVSTLGRRRIQSNSDCGVCGRLRCCLRYEADQAPGEPSPGV